LYYLEYLLKSEIYDTIEPYAGLGTYFFTNPANLRRPIIISIMNYKTMATIMPENRINTDSNVVERSNFQFSEIRNDFYGPPFFHTQKERLKKKTFPLISQHIDTFDINYAAINVASSN
jgi:hypothetical protein